MSEMVERVARAIWSARMDVHGEDHGPLEAQCEMIREWVFADARAALAAMREPTDRMCRVVDYELSGRKNWQAMIDAALAEEPPPSDDVSL